MSELEKEKRRTLKMKRDLHGDAVSQLGRMLL